MLRLNHLSFWIDAKRSESGGWSFGDGIPIRQVLIEDAGDGESTHQCLVSDIRKWHSESCGNQHQVICVSAPASCGTPGVPEFSSLPSSSWNQTKIAVNHSVTFSCEWGFAGRTADVRCFPNGSLSGEMSCTPTDDGFVASALLPAEVWHFLFF